MNIEEAKTIITEIVKYNLDSYTKGKSHRDYLVPYLEGNPGIGKTECSRQVAVEYDIPHRTTIVAQYDAGELGGFPMPDHENKKMLRYRPDFLPDGNPIPIRDKNGQPMLDAKGNPKIELKEPVSIWLIDELPQAPVANMNIVAQIVNEWRVGEHNITPGCTLVCAGNPASSRAGTNTMPTHLRDRLMRLSIEVDHEVWINWAGRNAVDPAVLSYIRKNPSELSKFDPKAFECPSPRSWAKVSAVLGMKLPTSLRTKAIAGLIGAGETVQFEQWLRVAERMPDPQKIVADPKNAPINFGSKDSDVLLLLMANLAALCTTKTVKNIIVYLQRLPQQDFAAYCMLDCINRCPEIKTERAWSQWAATSGMHIFS